MIESPRARVIALSLLACAIGSSGFTGVSRADSIRLPLRGYFHPGRAMPVEWNRTDGASGGSVDLSADGAVGVHVQIGSTPHVVFPWVILRDDPHDIRLRMPGASEVGFGSALHPLQAEDRLIGLVGVDDASADGLFLQSHKISVHLDSLRSLDGPAMAWESLDALVLTPEELTAISPQQQQELLAAGIMLAVTGASPPNSQLPWQKSGQLWVVAVGLPPLPIIGFQAFAPTYGWVGGKTADVRKRALLLGTIFCMLVWGVSLWRGAWMPALMIVLSAGAIALFALDHQHQSPVAAIDGNIELRGLPIAIEDHWIYFRAPGDADFEQSVDGVVAPVFSDESQIQQGNLSFICDSTGQPKFLAGHMQLGWQLAVLCRRVSQASSQAATSPVTSPLKALNVRSLYPGFLVVGEKEKPSSDELGESNSLGSIVLSRSAPP